MKRSLILTLTILFVFAAAGSLAAFDYGGTLTSGTSMSNSDITGIINEEELSLWLDAGTGDHLSFEMDVDLTASFTDEGFEFIINPDYLKLDGFWDDIENGPSLLSLSLGRFTASDFSSMIFSQKLDGIRMEFSYPVIDFSFVAGTTALMFADTGELLTSTPSTILSKTDAAQHADSTTLLDYLFGDDEDSTLFDSPRAVEILTVSAPQLIAGQTVTLSFAAQEDLRPMIEVISGYFDNTVDYELLQEGDTDIYPDRGGAFNTQYVGGGVSGKSIKGLYHNVYYYFGTGQTLTYLEDVESSTGYSYQYSPVYSHMAGFSLDYFMPELFNSFASLSVNFGTGDSDANSPYEGNLEDDYTQFTPITSGGGGIVFSPGLSNILYAKAGYSLKPIEWLPIPLISNMQVQASYLPFFRVTDGPIAVSGISPDFTSEDGNYLGSEIDLTVNMRPYSDLGIMLQGGFFIPNSEAFMDGSEMSEPTFTAKLNVSLSF